MCRTYIKYICMYERCNTIPNLQLPVKIVTVTKVCISVGSFND